jgi:OOP family OmpA-OmpF porin
MTLRPISFAALALLAGMALVPAYADEVPADEGTAPVPVTEETPPPEAPPAEAAPAEPVAEAPPPAEPVVEAPPVETVTKEAVVHSAALPFSPAFISGMGSYTLNDEDRGTKNGYGGLISIGRKISDEVAIEAYGLYTQMKPEAGDGSKFQLMGGGVDLMVFPMVNFPNIYGLFGGAYGKGKHQPGPVPEYKSAIIDTGIGMLYPLAERIILRGDVRLRMDQHGDKQAGTTQPGIDRAFTETVFNLGLLVPLGEIRQPEGAKSGVGMIDTASNDSDNDGVPDASDLCPGTPAGAVVNEKGCENDTDGDGVPDRIDQCPDTPAGEAVNEVGCPLDADHDGVPIPTDECPNTPPGQKVLPNGCALKGDCRTPRAGEEVDANGCAVEQKFVLNGVKFEFDSDRLTDDAKTILDGVVETLKNYAEIKIEVQGHTDWIGTEAYNQGLSERRARSVKTYLAGKGVPADHMTTKGFGESMPIDSNETDEGREKNRRVELKVLE